METNQAAAMVHGVWEEGRLPVREYQGRRVVVFTDVDRLHGQIEGAARRVFKGHREHFQKGQDYFAVPVAGHGPHSPRDVLGGEVILLTEKGYLLVIFPFLDDLAWRVHKMTIRAMRGHTGWAFE